MIISLTGAANNSDSISLPIVVFIRQFKCYNKKHNNSIDDSDLNANWVALNENWAAIKKQTTSLRSLPCLLLQFVPVCLFFALLLYMKCIDKRKFLLKNWKYSKKKTEHFLLSLSPTRKKVQESREIHETEKELSFWDFLLQFIFSTWHLKSMGNLWMNWKNWKDWKWTEKRFSVVIFSLCIVESFLEYSIFFVLTFHIWKRLKMIWKPIEEKGRTKYRSEPRQ